MKMDVKHEEFPARKYARKKLHQLTYYDKLNIIHNVMVNNISQKDTAKAFRVSHHLVSSLYVKVKKNPKFLEELKFEMQDKQAKVERIKDAAVLILK